MITPRLRPRLEQTIRISSSILIQRLRAKLEEPECVCRELITEQQIDLRIHERERHFWSPQLTIHVSPHDEDDNSTRLKGHFGPNANVWTMFLAAYGFVILSAIVGVFFGLSQMMIDQSPWALLSIPLAIMLVTLIYLAAGVGQRLGHAQVDVLQDFLHEAIADPGA